MPKARPKEPQADLFKPKPFLVKKLRIDGGTQSREHIDQGLVDEYAEAMAAGSVFPPVDVFYDATNYWVADGFHRTLAAIKAGLKKIEVNVHQGTPREAILFSVGANAYHGLRRSNADKRRAVMMLLNDEEWSQWTDAAIARRCGVSDMTVGRYRPESAFNNVNSPERKTTDVNGEVKMLNVAGRGRKPNPEPETELESDPETSPEPEHEPEPDYAASMPADDPSFFVDDDKAFHVYPFAGPAVSFRLDDDNGSAEELIENYAGFLVANHGDVAIWNQRKLVAVIRASESGSPLVEIYDRAEAKVSR